MTLEELQEMRYDEVEFKKRNVLRSREFRMV